jgi:hypothetical protein
MPKTMLPPRPSADDHLEGERFPYANQFIQLSFEGHLKPFELPPPKYGKRSSYTPAAPAAGDEPEAHSGFGFLAYWRSKLTLLYG